jgi:hypothetical protein
MLAELQLKVVKFGVLTELSVDGIICCKVKPNLHRFATAAA